MSFFSDLFEGIFGGLFGSSRQQEKLFLLPPQPQVEEPPEIKIGAEDDWMLGGRGKSQLLKPLKKPTLKLFEPNAKKTTSGIK